MASSDRGFKHVTDRYTHTHTHARTYIYLITVETPGFNITNKISVTIHGNMLTLLLSVLRVLYRVDETVAVYLLYVCVSSTEY